MRLLLRGLINMAIGDKCEWKGKDKDGKDILCDFELTPQMQRKLKKYYKNGGNGTMRYVIYDVLGWKPDRYVCGMCLIGLN